MIGRVFGCCNEDRGCPSRVRVWAIYEENPRGGGYGNVYVDSRGGSQERRRPEPIPRINGPCPPVHPYPGLPTLGGAAGCPGYHHPRGRVGPHSAQVYTNHPFISHLPCR